MDDWWSQLFDFSDYGALLALLQNSIIAGAVLGHRRRPDRRLRDAARPGLRRARHQRAVVRRRRGRRCCSASASSRARSSARWSRRRSSALLGARARDRNSIIGVLMPFGLGLGILFLALYPGRASNRFGLLTGQIVAVDDPRPRARSR